MRNFHSKILGTGSELHFIINYRHLIKAIYAFPISIHYDQWHQWCSDSIYIPSKFPGFDSRLVRSPWSGVFVQAKVVKPIDEAKW